MANSIFARHGAFGRYRRSSRLAAVVVVTVPVGQQSLKLAMVLLLTRLSLGWQQGDKESTATVPAGHNTQIPCSVVLNTAA
jgi:hypothetical protein